VENVFKRVQEAAYEGNLGFEEMLRFYKEARPDDIDEMERLLRAGKFKAAWDLLKRVTGVALRKLR